MVLDWDAIYSEASSAAFNGGKKRFYDNRVSSLVSGYEDDKFFANARVTGEQNYDVKIVFDEQGGLYDYTCNCGANSIAEGPCKHVVVAALAYESKYPSAPLRGSNAQVKARTDACIRGLITEYSKRKHNRQLSLADEKVTLSPILLLNSSDKLSLRFTIGRGRKYTLKDISDFVSCVNSGAYRRYGVELEMVHLTESFMEDSRDLLAFIMRSYREKVELLPPATNANYRDELRLIGGDVDEIFDLYSGRLMSFDDGAIRDGVRLFVPGENSFNVSVRVEEADGGYTLKSEMPSFRIVSGKRYRYLITDSRVHRLTEEYFNNIIPAIKSFESFKQLFISGDDMPQFYNSVLTQIMDRVEIVADKLDLSMFEAAPFVSRIYLAQENMGIIAQLKCTYDDVEVDILDDSKITDMVRDWESEGELRKLLQKYFPHYPTLELSGEAHIYNLMNSGLSELFAYSELYLADEIKRMKVKRPPRIRVGVRLTSNLLDVDLAAEGYTTEELIEVLRAYREKRSYIRLTDGSFVDLADSSIGALSEILEIAQTEAGQLKLPAYYAPFLDNELKNGFFELERSGEFKKLVKTLAQSGDSDIAVPESLKGIMRNYQKIGFRWLTTLAELGFGGILADDMGLGKSLQVIALLKESSGTSIIVCPTTLILNWVNEFNKFAPELKILPVMGNFSERKQLAALAEGQDVVITSYELLRRDDALYKDFNFTYAIIDEAQYIKNPETKNSRAVKTLHAAHRFALTGTPVENSLAELWSIFDFIMPGYLYSYGSFKERFESEVIRGDITATKRLQKLVQPFILRRLKVGVLKELPPKIESNMFSAMEGEQKKLYMANLSLIKDSVSASGKDVNKVVVLSMLTKLRQICCEPRLIHPDYEGNSAKMEVCMELIERAVEGGHKVLLFSQFTSMLDIIRKSLSVNGITHYILKGDTPKAERMKLVNRFNADNTQVFLISLKAGGTGLNLTGADVVIHYDPWWNESVMNQATDRAYRLGQDKSVQVYKLILEDSIEQKILKLQEKKTALGGLIVGGTTSTLSYDDIINLLRE